MVTIDEESGMKLKRISNSLGTFVFVTFRRPGKSRDTVAYLKWRDGAQEQDVYFFLEDQGRPGEADTSIPDDFIPTWTGDYCNRISVDCSEHDREDSIAPERVALKGMALTFHPGLGWLISKAQELYEVMDSGRAQSSYAKELMRDVRRDIRDAGLEFTAETMATLGVKRHLCDAP